MVELLHNKAFILAAMGAIIFAITQLVKQPIKVLTKRFIKNPRAKKMANIVILFVPFALGIIADILYSTYFLHTAFSIITGLGYGMAAISLYSAVERFFGTKIDNPYKDTKEGKAVVELTEEIGKDGKIDEKDADPIKAFWDKVK